MVVLVQFVVVCLIVRLSSAAPCQGTAAQSAPCECGAGSAICQIGDTCDTANSRCTGPQSQQGPPPQGQPPQQGPLRCQNQDGSLLPSATICEDTMDKTTCQAVFGGGTSGGTRSPQCDLADLSELALKCAKTCKICCETAEHECEDDASYGIDCEQQKSKCKIAQWAAVLFQACPLTCGLCNAGVCKDNIRGCSSLKTLCRDFTYRAYMEQNCAQTCKACQNNGGGALSAASNCVDTGYSCGAFVAWCRGTPEQQSTMRTSCKKTCGFC